MNLHDEIAEMAYELYESAGRTHGHDLDDWLAAEKIVLAMHAGQDLEEPEEEGVSGELVGVGARAKKIPAEDDETEEAYVNEEMS